MKLFFMITLTLLGVLLHVSVFSYSPILRPAIHLPLLLLVTWTLISKIQIGLFMTIVTGMILDLMSESPWGLQTIALTFAVAGSWWLFQTVITNRSLWSYLLLMSFATLSFRLLFEIGLRVSALFGLEDPFSLPSFSATIILFLRMLLAHLLLTVGAYVFFGSLLKSFRRHFLPLTHVR